MRKCLLSALKNIGASNAEERRDAQEVFNYCTKCYCQILQYKAEDFLREILNGNPKKAPTIYIGNRGTGKTFLFQCLDQEANRYTDLICYFPIKLWEDNSNLDYNKHIVCYIREIISGKLGFPDLNNLSDEEFWSYTKRSLNKAKKKIVVLIDGIDVYVNKKGAKIKFDSSHSFRDEFRRLYKFASIGNENLFKYRCGGIIIFNRSEIHKYIYKDEDKFPATDVGEQWFSVESRTPTEWIPKLVENYASYAISDDNIKLNECKSTHCEKCALSGNSSYKNKIASDVASCLFNKLQILSISRPRICVDLLHNIKDHCNGDLDDAIKKFMCKLRASYLEDELEVISALLGQKGLHFKIIRWIKQQIKNPYIIDCENKIRTFLDIDEETSSHVVTFLQMANILFPNDETNDSFTISDFVKHIYEV